jgi:cbb3-type cytochrome oxidase subunit 3
MSNLLAVIMWLQHNSVVFVFVVFLLMLVTLFWPGRRARFDRDARIPLDDDR